MTEQVEVYEAKVEVMPNENEEKEVTLHSRAEELKGQLLKLKDNIENNFFDLCDGLLEVQEGDYASVWGYTRFADWLEQASGLDLSARSAYYFINIAKKARQLGLTRDMMKQAKISKLKKIFELEPEDHALQMKKLIAASATETLESIAERVRVIKAKAGKEESVHITIKVSASVKETLERAIELAKKNYGDAVVGGEIVEPSLSQCMELILVSYVQDPNNQGE